MLRFARYIIPLLFLTIFLGSCGKIEQLSAVPLIEFRNFTVFDTIDILGNHSKGARLLFYFEDGDGDLGLDQPTSENSDTINLYLSLYRKRNGVMTTALPNDPLYRAGYRIPYMERLGQNKILKGTMTVSFLYSAYTSRDTIMYDIKIKDRAGNESNIVNTCEIVLSRNGDCDVPLD
jgi:hypothetical protein